MSSKEECKMPNHVTNILKVHGDEDKVRAMMSK